MLLLTGATGRVGSALLPLLTMRGEPVRCLVRDPRRLGPARVRVQIALGDLADPATFRHALRGVRTVVHLAGAWRDQPAAGLEELNGLATWRLLRAAERAGVERFLFLSPLGATPQHALRVHRAKALAEAAVADAALATDDLPQLADLRARATGTCRCWPAPATRACSRSRPSTSPAACSPRSTARTTARAPTSSPARTS